MTMPADRQPNLRDRVAKDFSHLLRQSRDDLRSESGLHADFVAQCIEAVDAKKERLGGPVTGEMIVHVVATSLKLDDKDRRLLAAAWLALYGYICLVDFELDQRGFLNARTSIAASALLGWGIATLGRYTSGTKYASVLADNINLAFSGQYQDLAIRAGDPRDRQQSDVDKNRAIVATVAGFCAAAGEDNDRLIRAMEAMLGPFQLFDDLQDLQEDFQENNVTALVRIVTNCADVLGLTTQAAMYRALIRDAKTIKLLTQAGEGIDQSLMLLDASRDQALITYLHGLRSCNIALIHALDEYQRDPIAIREPEIFQKIEQIANAC
jgi:hypothetical protein